MNIRQLPRAAERWQRSGCSWLVAGCMHVRAERVCHPFIDMFLSKQPRPRSARSSRRRCSSAASSSPGRSRTSPMVSSQNMRSSTTKKWVFTRFVCVLASFWIPFPPSSSHSLLPTLHFVFYLHAALSGIHKILQVPSLSHNCNNEWDAHKILIRL